MNTKKVSEYIVHWLQLKANEAGMNGFVVGVSGGIDSATVSTLCAITGLPLIVLNMPILQKSDQFSRAIEQLVWLTGKFGNVKSFTIDLTNVFKEFCNTIPEDAQAELALVNTRSRLRMLTLYSFANSNQYMVAGTGNKIEDYGIGFFTKYGDGGVDLSPIGDLTKSEVFELASFLGVPESIQKATPTDGLWEIDRSDEDQIGATYSELEWAMKFHDEQNISSTVDISGFNKLSERQKEVLKIYQKRHNSNIHKMEMPPVCLLESIK